jgi:hypothetical protein
VKVCCECRCVVQQKEGGRQSHTRKTKKQDDGASDMDWRCGRWFHSAAVDIEVGRIGVSAETREKKKDEHTVNAMLPTTSGSESLKIYLLHTASVEAVVGMRILSLQWAYRL